MPSPLDNIRSIIADKFFSTAQGKLIEENRDNAGVAFRMEKGIYAGTDCPYLLYRFDPDEWEIFPFFKETRGLNRICDYILFAAQNNKLYVLLIELKKGNVPALPQLTASQYFVEYLIKSGARIGLDFPESIIYRKIKVKGDTQGKKQKTQMQGFEPDENGIISYSFSQFRLQLLLES